MTDKLFKVVGTSKNASGNYKVRWGNDLVGRFKIFHKGGDTEIELFEMPQSMTKQQACQWLTEQPEFMTQLEPDARYAVHSKLEEYGKGARGEVKISLEEIKSRPTIEGWDVVNKEETTVDQYIREHQ